jgi:hypothetical protein
MSFRNIGAKILEPLSMWTMVVGIIALCQPWSEFLHRYGLTITLVGLAGFSVFSHFKPESTED